MLPSALQDAIERERLEERLAVAVGERDEAERLRAESEHLLELEAACAEQLTERNGALEQQTQTLAELLLQLEDRLRTTQRDHETASEGCSSWSGPGPPAGRQRRSGAGCGARRRSWCVSGPRGTACCRPVMLTARGSPS